MDAAIPFMMEKQMHCWVNMCVARFVTDIASPIHAMVMHEFGPVFCICVSIAKGMVILTLVKFCIWKGFHKALGVKMYIANWYVDIGKYYKVYARGKRYTQNYIVSI